MEEVQFLLLLVTVLTQTLLALVRSHLVTLVLLSVWHSFYYFIGLLLLNFRCKRLCRLECRNVVCRDCDSCILRDVTSNLLSTLLDDERAKTTKIYILLLCE